MLGAFGTTVGGDHGELAKTRRRKQWTKRTDEEWDERHSVKQGSPRDRKLDRERDVAKAFDPERRRHQRQALYEGGAAGGAVIAADQARRAGTAARRHSAASGAAGAKAGGALNAMNQHLATLRHDEKSNQPGYRKSVADSAANAGKKATERLGEAAREGRKAAWAMRRARGSGAAAAGLGVAAFGIHRYDRTRGR